MIYNLTFKKKAIDDIKKIKSSGRKIDLEKLYTIIEELQKHPTTGTGNPEPLKHNLSGLWSRRINKKDRLIYEIIEEPDPEASGLVVVVFSFGAL